MTVLRANLIHWSGGGGKYKLQYRVETDDPLDGPLAVEAYMLAEFGYRKGIMYAVGNESDESSFAGIPTVEPVPANRTNWIYSIDFSDSQPEQPDENPLNLPADFSRSAQLREEVIERDIHGRPIRNSAQDRFDEFVTRDGHRTVLRIAKNYASWPQSNYRFMNCVNRSPLTLQDQVFKPRQVRVLNMSDSTAYSKVLVTEENPRGSYAQVTLELCFAEDDWQIVMLDQGTRQSYRRFEVEHQSNSNISANVKTIIDTYNTPAGPRRIRTVKEAYEVANANFVFGWDFMREITPGYEPCRLKPPKDDTSAPEGPETSVPMMLDGTGRQQYKNGVPIWLEYQGYFEAEFARFQL